MKATSRERAEVNRRHVEELARIGWYHSLELPDGRVLKGLQSIEQLKFRLDQFPIPLDLRGKRVLDIGAWDGWFSFEMERRGANVVALDAVRLDRFLRAKELMGSRVEYLTGNIERLNPRELGYFDIVLFFGVLYHTKNPVQALENVCAMAREAAFVESFVTDEGDLKARPAMEFYELEEHAGQFDNWVGPNTSCLMAMCRTAGFARVQFQSVHSNRAHISCFRQWPEVSAKSEAPELVGVGNTIPERRTFSTREDDYLSIWFNSDRQDIAIDHVFPLIGAYASRPVFVGRATRQGWQVNCKLPPGLEPGRHDVRLRVGDSAWSEPVAIYVDAAPELTPSNARVQPGIYSVTDGHTWELSRVYLGARAAVSIWVSGLAGNSCVTVLLRGRELPASFVSKPDPQGLRQVNAILSGPVEPGRASISVTADGVESEPVEIELIEPR